MQGVPNKATYGEMGPNAVGAVVFISRPLVWNELRRVKDPGPICHETPDCAWHEVQQEVEKRVQINAISGYSL